MAIVPHPKSMFTFRRMLKGVSSLIIGPKQTRRRTIHEIARVLANIFGGHYVGDDYKLWLKDSEFVEKFKKMSPHNLFSMERKYTLKELAKLVKNKEGAIAEAGVYVGVSAWFLANELKGADMYLFDSFEGLSSPDEMDQSPTGVHQWEESQLSVSEDVARENLKEFSNIHFMKGWIPSRFQDVEKIKFKLVHIDVDLYQPTYDTLQFFYEKMVSGGVIVMDDYGFENCPGAYAAAQEYMEGKQESIVQLATGQGLIIKT